MASAALRLSAAAFFAESARALAVFRLSARWVPNRYTLALLGIGLAGQTAMVALDVTTFGRVAALLGIGLAIAVGMTLFGFWAPGEAKLFWAAVAALPPSLCPSPDPLAMQGAPFALILNSLLC